MNRFPKVFSVFLNSKLWRFFFLVFFIGCQSGESDSKPDPEQNIQIQQPKPQPEYIPPVINENNNGNKSLAEAKNQCRTGDGGFAISKKMECFGSCRNIDSESTCKNSEYCSDINMDECRGCRWSNGCLKPNEEAGNSQVQRPSGGNSPVQSPLGGNSQKIPERGVSLQVNAEGTWKGVDCSAGEAKVVNTFPKWRLSGRVLTHQSGQKLYCKEGDNGVACTCQSNGERFHSGTSQGGGGLSIIL